MENLFQDMPVEQRAQALKDNCNSVEENYRLKKFFTTDQLHELRKQVSDESIIVSELEDELKEVSQPIKSQIKDKKLGLRSMLKLVKQKYDESEETVYLFADHEAGMMLYYDALGELVSSRKLMPQERQTRIREMGKAS